MLSHKVFAIVWFVFDLFKYWCPDLGPILRHLKLGGLMWLPCMFCSFGYKDCFCWGNTCTALCLWCCGDGRDRSCFWCCELCWICFLCTDISVTNWFWIIVFLFGSLFCGTSAAWIQWSRYGIGFWLYTDFVFSCVFCCNVIFSKWNSVTLNLVIFL